MCASCNHYHRAKYERLPPIQYRISKVPTMIDPRLKEKVVLITGANNPHGIGAGVARAFAAQGSRVFLHYFRQIDGGAQHRGRDKATSPGESFYYSQLAKSADEVLVQSAKRVRPRMRGRPISRTQAWFQCCSTRQSVCSGQSKFW